MNERFSVRYDAELLPRCLDKVILSWMENSSIDSSVVNCCAHGMKVSIPPLPFPTAIPQRNDTVMVLMPIDQIWFTGMCVYATSEHDGSVSMGIYFYNPKEQNLLHNLLIASLNKPQRTCSFISHEWEELVDRLCASEDPTLQEIGYQEMELLRHTGK